MATPWSFHQTGRRPELGRWPLADFQCEGNIYGSGCSGWINSCIMKSWASSFSGLLEEEFPLGLVVYYVFIHHGRCCQGWSKQMHIGLFEAWIFLIDQESTRKYFLDVCATEIMLWHILYCKCLGLSSIGLITKVVGFNLISIIHLIT